jgi:hypothetical protein
VVTARPPASAAARERPFMPVVASLFFPIASNARAPHVRTMLALNAVYGHVGAVDGIQAGTINQTDDRVTGAQLALLVNEAGSVGGLQAAPLNLSGDVRGVQFGLVNVARKVHGVQLGLVNVADDVSGVPIGLVSVSKDGGVHPVVWGSTASLVNVGMKFATRYTYTQFSGSWTVEETEPYLGAGAVGAAFTVNTKTPMFGPAFALGFRVPMSRLVFEGDIYAAYLFGGPLSGVSRQIGLHDDMALDSLRAMLAFQVYRRLTLFAGAAATAKTRFYQLTDTVTVKLVPEFFGGVQL